MVSSLSLRKQRENPWGLPRPALAAAVHSAEGTRSTLRASFHPHHPQSGFVPLTALHGLTQVSLQTGSRYHWDHFWASCSLPLSPVCVPAMLVTQSQLDTALPTALSSLRATIIYDFSASKHVSPRKWWLWRWRSQKQSTPPYLARPKGGRAGVLSQGVVKPRA